MPLYFIFIQSFSIALLIVLGCTALRAKAEPTVKWLFFLLCISSISYHLRTHFEYEYWIPDAFDLNLGWLTIPSKIAMNAFSGLFMVFVYVLLKDGKRIPLSLLALYAIQIFLEVIIQVIHPQYITAQSPLIARVLVNGSGTLQALFSVILIYWVIADWRADLVEVRRRIRLVVVLYRGVWGVILVLVYRVLIPQDQPLAFQVHVAVLTINSLFFLVLTCVLLKFEWGLLMSAKNSDVKTETLSPASESESDPDWDRLRQALEQQKIYQESELSVASLAATLKIPQYRLRQLIVQKLGYRNFNALLHQYRLADACRRLRDPEQNHIPILTIALTVGYRSINPFNAAFKEKLGITPSEYRKSAPKASE